FLDELFVLHTNLSRNRVLHDLRGRAMRPLCPRYVSGPGIARNARRAESTLDSLQKRLQACTPPRIVNRDDRVPLPLDVPGQRDRGPGRGDIALRDIGDSSRRKPVEKVSLPATTRTLELCRREAESPHAILIENTGRPAIPPQPNSLLADDAPQIGHIPDPLPDVFDLRLDLRTLRAGLGHAGHVGHAACPGRRLLPI